MLNFIAIDLQLYKAFKITRVSFFGTLVRHHVISDRFRNKCQYLYFLPPLSHCHFLLTYSAVQRVLAYLNKVGKSTIGL